jgi:hypothetical protein
MARFLEAYSPVAHLRRSYRKDEDQSRWTTWIMGLGFITNIAFPVGVSSRPANIHQFYSAHHQL